MTSKEAGIIGEALVEEGKDSFYGEWVWGSAGPESGAWSGCCGVFL